MAEEERVKRLELEASLRHRRLTVEQQKRLGDILKRFGNRPISIKVSAAGASEAQDLVGDFASAIGNGGSNIPMTTLMMDTYFKGVIIIVGKNRQDEANALAFFLADAGLGSIPISAKIDPDDDGLTLGIGAKP